MTESQLTEQFRDWMNWTGPAPTEDDLDYYTYTWGLTVWIAAGKLKIK